MTLDMSPGYTEQSGPHLTLGKHSVRVRALAERVVRELGDALVAPVVAYVREGGAQGTVRHIRTNPTRRHLFVKFVSFDAYPFAIGEAFSQIGVDVHGLGGTLAAQLSEANIDVATVTLAAGAYSNESGHILYRKTRDWTFATLGYSSPASESVYATSCKVYRQTHEFLFNDKPYVDGMTLTIGGDMRNPSAWGAANGGLDAVTMVEENGMLQMPIR